MALNVEALLASASFLAESPYIVLEARGSDALDLMHRMSTNNLLTLKPGDVAATVLTTEKGRILDYVRVARGTELSYVLVSRGNKGPFIAWIDRFTIMEDVRLAHDPEKYAVVTLVGEKTFSALTEKNLPLNQLCHISVGGCDALCIAWKEFGVAFVNLIVHSSLKGALVTALAAIEFTELRAEAYTALRVTCGIPAFGHEITEAYNPYEAGLRHAISFTKGCYIGQEVIARLDTYDKVQKTLCSVRFAERPEKFTPGATLLRNGEEAGQITTICDEPLHDGYAALAILKKSVVPADDTIGVTLAGSSTVGRVHRFPAGR